MIILDTNALITMQTADKSSAHFIQLLDFLNHYRKMYRIALPMPAVAEFLAGDNNALRTAKLLGKTSPFQTLDFDEKSAIASAQIYQNYANLPKRPTQEPRQKVKVDIQILGIALANQAQFFVTCDVGIHRMVEQLGLPIQLFDYMGKI